MNSPPIALAYLKGTKHTLHFSMQNPLKNIFLDAA